MIQLTLGKVELGVVMVPPLESEERPCGGGPVVMEGGRTKAGEGKGEGSWPGRPGGPRKGDGGTRPGALKGMGCELHLIYIGYCKNIIMVLFSFQRNNCS